MKRSERLGAMTKILTETPNKVHPLGEFCAAFNIAKSTASEDIDLIRFSLEQFCMGTVDTMTGATGGVCYRPGTGAGKLHEILDRFTERLSEPGRKLAGGFLYTSDMASDPDVTYALATIFAAKFGPSQPDAVLTMETKGIPLAHMTAYQLGVPLVIARRDSRAYEGSAVKINYVSGNDDSSVETMALPRRSIAEGAKVLVIDDFMKGGGTLLGMTELIKEFNAQLVGVGVMIATEKPEKKRLNNARALFVLNGFDEETGRAIITPNYDFLKD